MTPGLRQWCRHTRWRRVIPWSLTLSNMNEKRSSTHYERRRASSGGPPVPLPSWAYPGKRSNRRSKSWESSGTASRRPDLSARVTRPARDADGPTPRIQPTLKKRPATDPKVPVIKRLSTGAAFALNSGDDLENRVSVRRAWHDDPADWANASAACGGTQGSDWRQRSKGSSGLGGTESGGHRCGAFPRHVSSRRDRPRSLSAVHKRLDCQRAGPRHIEVQRCFTTARSSLTACSYLEFPPPSIVGALVPSRDFSKR